MTSSTSSSSSTTHESSEVTSTISSPSSNATNTQVSMKQPFHHQNTISPSNFVKKPLNLSPSDRGSYSPGFQSGQYNAKQNNILPSQTGNFAPLSNHSTQKISPVFDSSPPLPSSNIPPISISKQDEAKRSMNQNLRDNSTTAQQRHIHLEHSNVNPNSKDTHV